MSSTVVVLYLQAQMMQFTAVPVTEMAPSTQTNSTEQNKSPKVYQAADTFTQ